MSTLYERTKEIAGLRKLSLEEVAIKAGLSNKALYQWPKSTPKADTLQKVAKVLNVSTDYLLGDTEEKVASIVTVTKKTTDAELDKLLDNTESYDGKTLNDRDRETMKSLIRAYVQNKPE